MKKKMKFMLVFGILLTISGVVLAIGNNRAKKVFIENTKKNIVKDYTTFFKQAEKVTNYRTYMYDEVILVKYTMHNLDSYGNNIKSMNEYSKLIDKLEKQAEALKKNCINKEYEDKEVDGKCQAFVINYEQTINSFVNDIVCYNNKITLYNSMTSAENQIKQFKTKYNYVDIDEDGEYSGRVESEE